jgi:hypothetical protein
VHRVKRVEEAVTLLYDLVMTARNNMLLVLRPEEWDRLVERGVLSASKSNSSLNSDNSAASARFPPAARRKEILAGAPRPDLAGVPLKAAGAGYRKGAGQKGRPGASKDDSLHIITDIPENDPDYAAASDSDEDSVSESEDGGRVSAGNDGRASAKPAAEGPAPPQEPATTTTTTAAKSKPGGRNSIRVPPSRAPPTRAPPPLPAKAAPALVSKTPPPGSKPSFPRVPPRGHRLVPVSAGKKV